MCLVFRYNPTFKVSRRSQATTFLRTRARHPGWVISASPAATRSRDISRRQPMPFRVHLTCRHLWGIPSTTTILVVLVALRAPRPGPSSRGGPGLCQNLVLYIPPFYHSADWNGSRFGHPSMKFFTSHGHCTVSLTGIVPALYRRKRDIRRTDIVRASYRFPTDDITRASHGHRTRTCINRAPLPLETSQML